jgi:hypothetical protein
MGGITIRKDFEDGTQLICLVDNQDLLNLFEDGTVEWPEIEDSDIDDRTQGDKLIKAIALVQIVWFFAQTLGRSVEGLAVTTLELFTLGNVGCAVITYLAWWNKPSGVRLPIVIEGVAPSWVHSHNKLRLEHELGQQRKSALMSLLVGFSFGALHLAAWNFHFASTAERMLWRISSIGVTILSATFPIFGLFFDNASWSRTLSFLKRLRLSPSLYTAQMTFLPPFLGLYCLFRTYMFVEMFVALRDVPVDVYKTVQWSQYFPSLG